MSEPADDARWSRINDLFHRALDLPPQDRAAFIDDACGADDGLAQEVSSLLAAHDRAGAFIERPVGSADELLREAARHDPRVGQTIGQYRIERVLGEGGMGVVYLAEDTRLGRRVALKSIQTRPTGDPLRQERLRREARAAASLSHPGIATVFALEEFGDETYLVSEFVTGETLRDELSRGPLQPRAALDAAIDIARALSAAHDRGIVHRDVKPENVMRANGGRMKILDFGLARIAARDASPRLTADGALLGTPSYMSPEQIRGDLVDERSDVFSMGALIHEMITGTPPFTGPTAAATMARILESEPDPLRAPDASPSATDAALLAQLEPVVRRALHKSPADRFDNATMLAAALDAVRRSATGQDGAAPARTPSSAPPPSPAPGPPPVATAGTLWWWQFHQAAASAAYLGLLVPLWIARDWSPGAPGLAMFVLGLAGAVTATVLRLHRWFAVRAYPAEWTRLRAESSTLLSVADSVFVLALLSAGLLIIDAHRYWGALLIASSAATLVSFAVIEPATTRAATLE